MKVQVQESNTSANSKIKFKNHVYAFEKHCEDPLFDYSQYLFPNEFPSIIFNGAI